MNKEEIVNKIVEKIKIQYAPEKIILFGSYAWGSPKKDSDVDLLIVKETDQKHRKRMIDVRRILRDENGLVGMDILVYTPQEINERLKINDSFISKIFKKGKIFYG